MITDLVIPALDERPNVAALFGAVDPLRGAVVRHVVLADNGSTDGTPEAAAQRGAIVVREPRTGYGAACLAAIAYLESLDPPPDVIVFLDADLADDPGELPDLLEPIARGTADLVIGSRVRRAEPGALNIVQRFGNGLACTLMRLATGRRYSDLGPFRAVRLDTLRRLGMTDRTWGWTVQMQMKAALLNIPATEIDVVYRRRGAGRSKISGTIIGVVRAGSKIIWTIIALWWTHRPTTQTDQQTNP